MEGNNVIKLTNVTKIYGGGNIVALNDVSVEVKKGEIVGVIGRNGAGKSTMFKIICGLIKPDKGKVNVNKDIGRLGLISYLPEERGLDTRQIIEEHLVDLLCYKGIRRKDAIKMISKWLKEFDMYDFRYRRIDSLSKGNQQKLQFISAIANEPKIIILDEPFTGLDSITSDFLWEKIEMLKEQGSTILYSTHNLNDKLLLSDRFVFVVHGKVVEQGTLSEIQNNYDMVLEVESEDINEEVLYQFIGKDKVHRIGNRYMIKVDREGTAQELFRNLGRPFCKTFCIRRLSISELFRLFNQVEEDDES